VNLIGEMSTAIPAIASSTSESTENPNSIQSILKKSQEQKTQALSDTKYDSKSGIYEKFENPYSESYQASVILSFGIAAGILYLVSALLPQSRRS
jgi:hypothetical protein